MIIEPEPYATFERPHEIWVIDLLELRDGSLITCGSDRKAKRWSITTASTATTTSTRADTPSSPSSDSHLQLVGVYEGHCSGVTGVVERYNSQRNEYTIITASFDGALKEWDIASCHCIETHLISRDGIECMIKTKDESRLVLGLSDGTVQIRSVKDTFDLIQYLQIHTDDVEIICELDDGTFVSGSRDRTDDPMARWSSNDGRILQTFEGHTNSVFAIFQLNSEIIVSGSRDKTIKMWKLSSGDCTHTLTLHSGWVNSLLKLSNNKFASGSSDGTIRVWNDRGDCIQTIQTQHKVMEISRLKNNSIVIANSDEIAIRHS